MTTPPAPPPDPDAGLTDEQKAAKSQFKTWFNEAFTESITALREEEEKAAPERTKKPEGSDWFGKLFGSGAQS